MIMGLPTKNFALVASQFDLKPETIATEQQKIAALSNECLKLLDLRAAVIFVVANTDVCVVVRQQVRLSVMVTVNAIVHRIAFSLKPVNKELIPDVKVAAK